MVIIKEETQCNNCHMTLRRDDAALEGSRGSLYCSPTCYDESERDADPLEPIDEDEEDA